MQPATPSVPDTGRATIGVPFEYVNTRVRALRSRLYEGSRLKELAGRSDMEQLARELCPDEETGNYLELERCLRQQCHDDLVSVLVYLDGPIAALLKALLRRFQVRNLEAMLRELKAPEEQQDGLQLLELPADLALPADALRESSDINEFAERLPDPYREPAAAALDNEGDIDASAAVEMSIQKAFWQAVHEALSGLSAGDRRACRPPLEEELAANRLLSVLRASRTFGMEWNTIAPLLPEGSRLSEEEAEALCDDPSPENVRAAASYLEEAELEEEVFADLPRLEEALWNRAVEAANRRYYGSLDTAGVLVAYYYLKRQERRRLTGAVEMLQLGLSRSEREQRLA